MIGFEFVITAVWGEIILVANCKKHGSGKKEWKWEVAKRRVTKLFKKVSDKVIEDKFAW